MARVKILVKGIVQGVGFRPFIYRIAVSNNLNGYVRNKGDAGVEILLEGREDDIKDFLMDLKEKKPPLADIYDVIVTPLSGENIYDRFIIHRSSKKTELPGSVIPPDIAICDECLRELRDPKDPRYDYFFITCTNCGPRFTIIDRLPYDRENTTMRDFPMCSFCRKEYTDPLNRRFHAQTVACAKCGPRAYLSSVNGERIECKDPIREAGRLISEGFIVAVKGYGGFHIAAATIKDEPLIRLRRVKHRRQKPFAIMARSMEAVKSFAEVNPREEALLKSFTRPIVLLKKSPDYYLSDLISPGLHNVGVMLPYTGLHYMLFDWVDDPAFVMTSANPPNQPIVKDDEEALRRLKGAVDYFLFNNRRIAYRCDDSVMRVHGDRQVFIRRSRGYAPAPIRLKKPTRYCSVGLGGELNNTACILLEDKAFLSQHIGDVENIETYNFLKDSVEHLIDLTNSKVEVISCDLHPKFVTTHLAYRLAEEKDLRLIQVQHHHAHIAALMAEHNVDEIIGICCDGYGYGLDGEAWGGEILLCTRGDQNFKRLAHLQEQPLIGGDLATIFPLRMAAGILYGAVDVEEWLLPHRDKFPHGEAEIKVILHQLRRGNLIKTTSCGRILDAAAAILGICYERTYEGEPAMKLEAAAFKGRDVLKLNPEIEGDMLKTTDLILEIYENRKRYSRNDLAYSAHVYLARGVAELAIEKADENGIEAVGFSGGVACNEILTSIIKRTVEDSGLKFLVHEMVPPGDGGISLGQAFIGSFIG